MTPQVSVFIPVALEETDKYIEVAGGYNAALKQKGQAQIKMCNDNGDNFITTLHKVLLAPDKCNRVFSIIMLINSVHTCLFHRFSCMVYPWCLG